MEETANTILTKLKLVDPTLSPFSAYQQSAEVRQLWTSVETSIITILSVTSSVFSTDPIDASSQIITVLSASTLLSSVIHAIISTQKRINKSDENIETIIQKETQVILYHIQILKQDINQSSINAESAQEAIIHHTNLLVDSLVAYSLTPSNTYQIHPYQVSPSSSTSFARRHSQPAHCHISQSSSNEELSSKSQSLNTREKSGNTVGKKFMQSINSLKQRPAFNKTLLPNRHTLQPSNSEQPPNKKRIFFDRLQEEESDDDSTSPGNSNSRKTGNATLRFILNGGRQQKNQSSTNARKASKDMKQIFPSKGIQSELASNGKKKRESISTFFSHNRKESITKEKKQDSFYSSSTISSSSESMNNHFSSKIEERPHLISPFSKKTDIQWSTSQLAKADNTITRKNEFYRVESIHNDDEDQDSEGSYNPTATSLKREKSRKRRSNGSLISPITMKNAPLPPLPTVENFLAIMDASSPPGSPYFSARSASSSTLDSIDDLTDSMASAHIMEPCLSTESSTSSNSTSSTSTNSSTDTLKQEELLKAMSLPPPPVPPKDAIPQPDLLLTKKKKRASAVEMRVSTNDVHRFFSPKSADVKSRPKSNFAPPRRSSMPLPPPMDDAPPMPLNAKQITDAYNDKKNTPDDSAWSSLLGIYKKEEPNSLAKKAKLRRSLGSVPKKNKKFDGNANQMLKVTENGQVVLLYEMIGGRFQVIAGTPERLFEKLADETTQDTYFIDTYIMHHSSFTDSDTFLNQLICRFHLGPSLGEYEYFKKWQHTIQTKVLNVIDRWITIQHQDFKQDTNLQKKLNMFLLSNEMNRFKQHIHKIQQNMKNQINQTPSTTTTKNPSSNFQFPFVNSTHHISSVHIRRPSNGLFNLPSTDPVITQPIPVHTSLVSLESKDIARYLTLADYYLLRSIFSSGALNSSLNNKDSTCIEVMTKRANMLSHWVVHEISSLSYSKPKRALVKKFIEIAKLCLDVNNYHTCMVLTMGLASAPKLTGVWESLSSRDMNTFTSLQKLLDVSMNMRHYRHKIQLAKPPCVPFLPVILKDQTFFNENSTFLVSHPNLINFAKFTSIRQFIDKAKEMTSENYWFAKDLSHYPFLPSTKTRAAPALTLDYVADWVEHRLAKVPDYYDH